MPSFTRQDIAAELRAAMARKGVTQRALGRALGIGPTQMYMRMNGRMPFNLDELAIAAEYLDVDLVDLFPRRRPRPPLAS